MTNVKSVLKELIQKKDFQGLKALLESIPSDLDIPQELSDGKNILFLANTDQRIFNLLLQNPKINKKSIYKPHGTTALYNNIKNISIDNFRTYLKEQPHEKIRFKFGNEPDLLFACASKLRWDLVEELIDQNFPINDNSFHDNILTICSRNRKLELVQKILNKKSYSFTNTCFKKRDAVNYRPLNSHLEMCFHGAKNISEFNNLLFNNTNSKKSKILSQYVFDFSNNTINYVNLSMIDLCIYLNLDINYALNFITTNLDNPINFCISDAEKKILKQIFECLSRNYPKERVQKLYRSIPACFTTDLAIESQDILNMMVKAEQNSVPLPKKPKSFVDLRTLMIRLMRKIEQENFELTPQLGIKVLENIKLKSEPVQIYIPVNNFELIDASHFINICVGSGEYASKILDEESLIVLIKENDKLKYCVELDYKNFFHIIQAKGEGNSEMPIALSMELQEKIFEIMERYLEEPKKA